MKSISLTIDSKRSEILKFENQLEKVNKEFGLSEEKFVNLQIASSEALVNAIVHGNKGNLDKKVHIDICFSESEIIIKIKDEGTGFIADKVPDPTEGENIFKEHGRGLFIMKSLVDVFECNPGTDGTELILKVLKT